MTRILAATVLLTIAASPCFACDWTHTTAAVDTPATTAAAQPATPAAACPTCIPGHAAPGQQAAPQAQTPS